MSAEFKLTAPITKEKSLLPTPPLRNTFELEKCLLNNNVCIVSAKVIGILGKKGYQDKLLPIKKASNTQKNRALYLIFIITQRAHTIRTN
jgi:hypothetical protein